MFLKLILLSLFLTLDQCHASKLANFAVLIRGRGPKGQIESLTISTVPDSPLVDSSLIEMYPISHTIDNTNDIEIFDCEIYDSETRLIGLSTVIQSLRDPNLVAAYIHKQARLLKLEPYGLYLTRKKELRPILDSILRPPKDIDPNMLVLTDSSIFSSLNSPPREIVPNQSVVQSMPEYEHRNDLYSKCFNIGKTIRIHMYPDLDVQARFRHDTHRIQFEATAMVAEASIMLQAQLNINLKLTSLRFPKKRYNLKGSNKLEYMYDTFKRERQQDSQGVLSVLWIGEDMLDHTKLRYWRWGNMFPDDKQGVASTLGAYFTNASIAVRFYESHGELLAHEIGHLLGAQHDCREKECSLQGNKLQPKGGCCKLNYNVCGSSQIKFIMDSEDSVDNLPLFSPCTCRKICINFITHYMKPQVDFDKMNVSINDRPPSLFYTTDVVRRPLYRWGEDAFHSDSLPSLYQLNGNLPFFFNPQSHTPILTL